MDLCGTGPKPWEQALASNLHSTRPRPETSAGLGQSQGQLWEQAQMSDLQGSRPEPAPLQEQVLGTYLWGGRSEPVTSVRLDLSQGLPRDQAQVSHLQRTRPEQATSAGTGPTQIFPLNQALASHFCGSRTKQPLG